jgi:AcrR family transcriptional regulator
MRYHHIAAGDDMCYTLHTHDLEKTRMPAIVDHEQRRRDIAELAVKLIARYGVQGVTIRQLAAAADCSTAALTHYFRTKEELLLFTFRHASDRHLDIFGEPAGGWTPMAVRRFLELSLPLTPRVRDNWLVFFTFLSTPGLKGNGFARERAQQIQRSRSMLSTRLRQAYNLAEAEADALAERCQIAVIGLAMELCYGLAKGKSPAYIQALADSVLDPHLPGTSRWRDVMADGGKRMPSRKTRTITRPRPSTAS